MKTMSLITMLYVLEYMYIDIMYKNFKIISSKKLD